MRLQDGGCGNGVSQAFNEFRDSYGPHESKRIIKNVIMIGLSFAVLFTAAKSFINIQSSIKTTEPGAELYSMIVLYVAYLIAALFLPSLCLSKLKWKSTMLFSISGYAIYIAAQFYPIWGTLITAGIYAGICTALLWVALPIYITRLAEEYALLNNETPETVIPRFFGTFFLLYQSSQIFQSISSLALSNYKNNPNIALWNVTQLRQCGVEYCDAGIIIDESSHNATLNDESSNHDMNILWGTLLVLACSSGIIIVFFVDSLARYGENERSLYALSKWHSLLSATIKHWSRPEQLLLIPITIWYGISESFLTTEFTKGYIKCAWGIDKIGFVMISFGVSAAITSFVMGRLIAHVGRIVIFCLAASLNAACLFAMLLWEPNSKERYVFFVLAGLWGCADGIWSPQLKALYGTMFPNTRDAAFSNLNFWTSIGYILVYSVSQAVCMKLKLYLYLCLLVLGVICYGFEEIVQRLQLRKKIGNSNNRNMIP